MVFHLRRSINMSPCVFQSSLGTFDFRYFVEYLEKYFTNFKNIKAIFVLIFFRTGMIMRDIGRNIDKLIKNNNNCELIHAFTKLQVLLQYMYYSSSYNSTNVTQLKKNKLWIISSRFIYQYVIKKIISCWKNIFRKHFKCITGKTLQFCLFDRWSEGVNRY